MTEVSTFYWPSRIGACLNHLCVRTSNDRWSPKTQQSWVVNILSYIKLAILCQGKLPPVAIKGTAWWNPEPMQILWRWEKFLPVNSLVAISTELSWFKSQFVEFQKKKHIQKKLISEYETKKVFSLRITFKNKLDHAWSDYLSQNLFPIWARLIIQIYGHSC